jgi:hypothetical protein
METLAKRGEIEIRIGNVDLTTKLDALGAALAAVREAHREQISPKAWAALHRAQENIAEAMMYSADGGRRQLSQGTTDAPGQKAGYNHHTTPAGALITPAGTGAVDI